MCNTLSITIKMNTKSKGRIATSERWPKRVNLGCLLRVASSFITRKTSKVNTAARPKEAIWSLLAAGLTVVIRVEITINFHIMELFKLCQSCLILAVARWKRVYPFITMEIYEVVKRATSKMFCHAWLFGFIV